MNANQCACWVNAGWDDFAVKSFNDPSEDYGRYSKDELILAQAGFKLAQLGYPKITTKDSEVIL